MSVNVALSMPENMKTFLHQRAEDLGISVASVVRMLIRAEQKRVERGGE